MWKRVIKEIVKITGDSNKLDSIQRIYHYNMPIYTCQILIHYISLLHAFRYLEQQHSMYLKNQMLI